MTLLYLVSSKCFVIYNSRSLIAVFFFLRAMWEIFFINYAPYYVRNFAAHFFYVKLNSFYSQLSQAMCKHNLMILCIQNSWKKSVLKRRCRSNISSKKADYVYNQRVNSALYCQSLLLQPFRDPSYNGRLAFLLNSARFVVHSVVTSRVNLSYKTRKKYHKVSFWQSKNLIYQNSAKNISRKIMAGRSVFTVL